MMLCFFLPLWKSSYFLSDLLFLLCSIRGLFYHCSCCFFWGPQRWAPVSMAERFKPVPRVSSYAPLSSITRSTHTPEPITQPLETPAHLNLHPRPDATALGCVYVIGGYGGVSMCLGNRLMTILREWGLKHPLNDIIISKITKSRVISIKGSLVDLRRQASLLLLLKHSVWDLISMVVSLWSEELLEKQFEICHLLLMDA